METVIAMKLLTLNEVAEMLRKSPAQIRWMIHSGTAPKSALIGGRRMFREFEVMEWLNAAFEADGAA
ncbi:helix-turn-helix transcriptional regulator [Arthrobacter zhaoxinii]|uniref:helix-turn-helix transcriptional regulator n=1 Tax=Arthrobacter zhaoxinii TaxID=2964616 RepID=UPI002102BE95|nr:helix-turn-helix domain-containing protein [Arthrobacter zhaoxinii]MCQ1999534.1 helix-turn-helix domain-containing protein [Arthrobacter zhaoxinii]